MYDRSIDQWTSNKPPWRSSCPYLISNHSRFIVAQGPEFTELEEDFQDSLVAYVREECGIDEDVAAFISMYADFKEQNSYVNWMKQVKSILE